ncbi:MAG TPA: MAPEG family protein [Xanthomonadaceae bacterium]|nr:MAPEG family protein [Xanthomonadaceae bacterium]
MSAFLPPGIGMTSADQFDLLLPMFAMVLLTFAVWMAMYRSRIREIRARRIRIQNLATRGDAAQQFQDTRAADNFQNLFELPVLFHAGVLATVMLGLASPLLEILAWVFVLSRVAHSFIHVTYNRVIHRFYVYAFGGFVLLAYWIVLAVGWLSVPAS